MPTNTLQVKQKYYWKQEGHSIVLRQERFRKALEAGREHPHDIMAYANHAEDMRSMWKLITGEEMPENEIA